MQFTRRGRAALGKLKRRLRGAPATPPPAKARPANPKTKRSVSPSGPSRYPALPGDRLLERPVFVLSSVRSGSTLLRVMLNTHSAIHAPHETHLAGLRVKLNGRYAIQAMAEMGLDEVQLEYLLRDRVLHRELTRHGKSVVVNKTPGDAFRWRRILECWPDARFIFLLRHPAAIADSLARAHPERAARRVEQGVLRHVVAVERARAKHGGLTVRYEDITIDPEKEMKRVCEFIGVEWEPSMVDYGQGEHGGFQRGLGDWSERIRSGKVQPVERLPSRDEIPPRLLDISVKWGYVGS